MLRFQATVIVVSTVLGATAILASYTFLTLSWFLIGLDIGILVADIAVIIGYYTSRR